MHRGWLFKYKLNRPLTKQEKVEALKPTTSLTRLDTRLGLIRINSAYIDWIDSRFRLRGMLESSGSLLVFIVLIVLAFLLLCASIFYFKPILLIPSIFSFICSLLPYFICLRHEFFTYTHYPIRFNRETRMIYIFNHNGEGGVVSVPWDDVYFHVGRDKNDSELCNIRGEIMEGDLIRNTFSVGNDSIDMDAIQDQFDFIYYYMEEGAEYVGARVPKKRVGLSVTATWDNCYISGVVGTGVETELQMLVMLPFAYWLAATRWLIMKTCKEPFFPRDIEQQNTVSPTDPNIWPIRTRIGRP